MTFGEIRIFFDNWEFPIIKRNVFNNDPVPVMGSEKGGNYGKGSMLSNYLVYHSLDEFPGQKILMAIRKRPVNPSKWPIVRKQQTVSDFWIKLKS